MAAGPDTPTTYQGKADLAAHPTYRLAAHMAITDASMTVMGEDNTVFTTYLAGGFVKRRALAAEVLGVGGAIQDTAAGRPPEVIQRIWTAVCSNWASDKDPAVAADMVNQISARWDDVALLDKGDKA